MSALFINIGNGITIKLCFLVFFIFERKGIVKYGQYKPKEKFGKGSVKELLKYTDLVLLDLKMPNEEKYLVEDKAYDGGLNQTSTPAVFSNEEICVLHLVKGKAKENIEYMYVFNFFIWMFFF